MSKVFTYERTIESGLLEDSDELEEFVEEFEYEVDEENLLDAVIELVYEDYFCKSKLSNNIEYRSSVKQGLRRFIEYLGNLDDLVEEYESDLKDIFEQEAMDSYER